MMITMVMMCLVLTFLGLGLFLDALFPGSERSKVNFKPSPVKVRRSATGATLIKVYEWNTHSKYP